MSGFKYGQPVTVRRIEGLPDVGEEVWVRAKVIENIIYDQDYWVKIDLGKSALTAEVDIIFVFRQGIDIEHWRIE